MAKIEDIKVRISAEIGNFNSEIKKISSGLKEAQKEFSGLSKAGEAMTSLGKKLMPITGVVTGIGVASAKTAIDFDASMNKVSAISGATGKDLDALREMAKKMGSETKYSAKESAEAMSYMGMAGWNASQMIDGLPGILNLASASGADLALTSDIVTDGLTSMGLTAKDTNKFVDIMASTCSNSNTSVELMGETLKYAGSTAGALGIDMADLSVAIGLMANSGIKGSQAGTALRAGLVNLAKPTKEMQKAMSQYGIELKKTDDGSVDFMATMVNMRDKLKDLDATTQAQVVSTIFGKEAMAGWQAVINATDEDFESLTKAIAESDGTAQKMADTMNQGASGALTEMKSAIEGVAITIGERLAPMVEKCADFISGLCRKFQELSPEMQNAVIIFAGLLAVIPPILVVVGSLMKGFATLKAISVVTGIAMGTLSASFLLIPLAIVAVVGAIATLIANWDWVKEKAKELGDKIAECWDNIVNWTKEKWNTMWETISNWWSNLMSSIGEWLSSVGEAISNGWQACVDWTVNLWNSMCEAVSSAWETIKNFVQVGIMFVGELIKAGLTIILLPWLTLWENCKDVIIPIWEKICSFVSEKLELIKTYVSEKLEAVKKFFTEKWNNVKDKTSEIYEKIATTVSEKLEQAKKYVTEKLEAIKTSFTEKWNAVKQKTSEIYQNISKVISEKLEQAKSYVSEKTEAIKGFFRDKFEQAKSVVTEKMNSIKQSIQDKINAGKDAVSKAVNAIKSKFDIFGTIASNVSSKFDTIKTNITNKINGARDAVSNAINRMKSILNITLPFPKIKLPHFSISGKFSLNPPSVPKFSVQWYNKGAIFKRKTVLPGGIGVGDASYGGVGNNAEAILPINKLPELLGLDKKQNDSGLHLNIEQFNNNREQDIEKLANELAFYLKRKSLVGGA